MENKGDDEIKDSLYILYFDEIDEIIEDFRDPEKIFNHYEWSACFDCEKCQIKSDCHQFDFLKLLKKVQDIQKNNLINQNNVGF